MAVHDAPALTPPVASSIASVDEARAVLAQEWHEQNPTTPDEIELFYRTSTKLGAELDAWHEDPERRKWTAVLVHLARQISAQPITPIVVDVGCGGGHDLAALRADMPPSSRLYGVELNTGLRARARQHANYVFDDTSLAPISDADLVSCFDVLEHVPDPEAWLKSWAGRMKLGALLVETTATHDIGTPLHLTANRGWHPGRCLESLGFEVLDSRNRLNVWQRVRLETQPKASVLLCAYRSCSIPTMNSIGKLQLAGWRVYPRWGDGFIARSRSIVASQWYRETADDVFLMIDDDIIFEPYSAERIVDMCRNGHDIIAAAYPVRDGGHLAVRGLNGPVDFGPDAEPVEARFVSTGFMAVHRRVLDAIVPTLPLCHANMPWAFWPMFDTFWIEEPDIPDSHTYLSEDWAFVQRARDLNFSAWLDPTIRLGHLAQIEVNVVNMDTVDKAVQMEAPR